MKKERQTIHINYKSCREKLQIVRRIKMVTVMSLCCTDSFINTRVGKGGIYNYLIGALDKTIYTNQKLIFWRHYIVAYYKYIT